MRFVEPVKTPTGAAVPVSRIRRDGTFGEPRGFVGRMPASRRAACGAPLRARREPYLRRDFMKAINPATEQEHVFEETPIGDIAGIVARARAAQDSWGERSVQERADVLTRLSERIEAWGEEIARSITDDIGRPIKSSRVEVAKTADQMKYLCAAAPKWLALEEAEGGFIQFEPLGVVAVISPWNGPFIVPVLSVVSALLAGNTVVLKPSEFSLGAGQLAGRLFEDVDAAPRDLVQTIIGGKDHGRELLRQDVDMVSFTGSRGAGKEIMQQCSQRLCRVLLELGGLDAAIVLNDADVASAARTLVRNNCYWTGQNCCAVKRVYVERDVYDRFVAAAVEESKKVTYGDPDDDVDMGPLVAQFQLEKVEAVVDDARSKGAQILTGGRRPDQKGFFFPSTVVTNVNHEMKIMKEEPFGPLLPIFPVDSWQEAVKLANDTRYGLTGSVWTGDEKLGRKIMGKLEVGVAGLNVHGIGPVGTPYGGTKESGIGRIKSKDGMRAHANVKMVRLRP
jgi:acyl-CoA reductase-like NAD-dependent aldehyde dehydrogenase